jgi:hypothetical protein
MISGLGEEMIEIDMVIIILHRIHRVIYKFGSRTQSLSFKGFCAPYTKIY